MISRKEICTTSESYLLLVLLLYGFKPLPGSVGTLSQEPALIWPKNEAIPAFNAFSFRVMVIEKFLRG